MQYIRLQLTDDQLQITAKHGGGNVMVQGGAFSQGCVSLLQIINTIMEKTQYKDTLKKVSLPIPEKEYHFVGFSNDIITQNTVPSSSKADFIHRKYIF
jgi:hypothetical protein